MAPGPESFTFTTTWSRWFFAACILYVLYLAYRLVEPYLVPIFLAVVLVVVAGPLYSLLARALRGRRTLASALSCLIIFVILVLPFFFMAGVITAQALDLYNTVSNQLSTAQLQKLFDQGMGRLDPYIAYLQQHLGFDETDVVKHVGEWVKEVSNLLYSNLATLVKGFTNVLINFVLILFVTFYLFMDGQRMGDSLLALSPLPVELNQRIRDDFLTSLRSTLKGTVVLAFIQGVGCGLGFWVFGVPNAPFWGTVMVFASVVPMVGTALVWAPACVYLVVLGSWGQAIGVGAWSLVVGVISDNILRPKLLGGAGSIHPLLTFFSVLGGLAAFGMVGLILGPLVLAMLLSLVDVYQRYFLTPVVCEPLPPGQTQAAPPEYDEV
ncbi:MAG: AI-2E family transporter [Pseudomonadota bacterium]